ncbi:hypothetical protein TNCV_2463471 [Trichonephila clavipes]|nr:hypothetical protein TNCV_2463471 [Trichonephila clavipes]
MLNKITVTITPIPHCIPPGVFEMVDLGYRLKSLGVLAELFSAIAHFELTIKENVSGDVQNNGGLLTRLLSTLQVKNQEL